MRGLITDLTICDKRNNDRFTDWWR